MAASSADDELRVGNADRERAIGLLNDALTGGYLDVYEFDERIQRVYAARSRGDLREVLDELPAAVQLFPGALPIPTGELVESASTAGLPDRQAQVTINAQAWSTLVRKGSWRVPARTLLSGSMGTFDLDLSQAILPDTPPEFELQLSWSTVKLRLSPTQVVRYDELQRSGWSPVRDRAGPPSRAGGAVIVLRGGLSTSTLVIRRNR